MLRLVPSAGNEQSELLRAELRGAAALDDDRLADFIVERCAGIRDLTLDLFLANISGLADRPVVLDSAIEMVLKSMRVGGVDPGDACRQLAERYPDLAVAIHTAHALAEAMIDTTLLAAQSGPAGMLELPADVGPKLSDGKPRYRLHQLLGTGAQGTVYLGQDRSLSEPESPAWVAIKQVSSDLDGEEATKARRVVHANVVRVLDKIAGPDHSWMVVFEYVRGGSLEATRKKAAKPIPVAEAVRLVLGAAKGVQAAHNAGLVHRDLKPANILLGEDGAARVSDFGISHRLLEQATPDRVGSLGFMSPQQFTGQAPTAQDDVYALGGILYWLLTGLPPNGSNKQAATRALSDGTLDGIKALRDARPEVDGDLERICTRALSPSTETRYASADAFASDLASWLRQEPIAWTNPTLKRRLALAFRQAPKSWSGALLGTLVFFGVLIGAAYLIGSAEVARQKAANDLLRSKQAAQDDRLKNAATVTSLMSKYLRDSSSESAASGWVHIITFVESIFGPRFVTADEDAELWRRRVTVAKDYLKESKEAGRSEHLEPLLIESALCLWLLRDFKGEETLAHLDAIEPRWKAILPPDDEWLAVMRVFRECALMLMVDSTASDAQQQRKEHFRKAQEWAAPYLETNTQLEKLFVRMREALGS